MRILHNSHKNQSLNLKGQLLYMSQDVHPTPRRAAFGVASSLIPDGTARQEAK